MAGCAPVGPNFKPPLSPQAPRYTESPLAAQTASADTAAGSAQRYVPGGDIPADWWELFRSPALDKLVRMALADSPTLDAARAALVQAREQLNVQYAVLYPSVDAAAGVTREQVTGASLGQPKAPPSMFTLYNASVNVSYAIDVAGGARRELEALLAQIDYQKLQLEAAHLALAGNVVTAAVQEASLRAQIGATREVVEAQEKILGVVEQQFALGAVSRAEVLAQRAQLRSCAPRCRRCRRRLRRRATRSPRSPAAFPPRPGCPSPSSRSCSCRRRCRSACPRSSRASAPTSALPKRCCTRPALRSASPKRRNTRVSR